MSRCIFGHHKKAFAVDFRRFPKTSSGFAKAFAWSWYFIPPINTALCRGGGAGFYIAPALAA